MTRLTNAQEAGNYNKSNIGSWFGFLLRMQPAVWLCLGLLYFAFDTNRMDESIQWVLLARAFFWALIGAALSSVACLVYHKLAIDRLHSGVVLGLAIFTSVILSVIWLVIFNWIDGLVEFEPGWVPILELPVGAITGELTDRIVTLAVWHVMVLFFIRSQSLKNEKERSLKLEKIASNTRMDLLRSQLNPHFLFNSLNCAIALSNEDPEKVGEVLKRLSSLLRVSLSTNIEQKTTLKRELELVENYIQIEKIRFEDKLVFKQEVEQDALMATIPPLVLLPLVENAVKHGMKTSPIPLKVNLKARVRDNSLEILVSNTGKWNSLETDTDEDGFGIGLRTLRERLTLELLGDHVFTIKQQGEIVQAKLLIEAKPTQAKQSEDS